MDVSDIITLIGVSGGTGLLGVLGSIVYFRPRLRVAQAEAQQKETEAQTQVHDAMEARLASMEDLYRKQGEAMDSLRTKLLEVEQELYTVKSENQIMKLKLDAFEAENASLKKRLELVQTHP